MKNVQRIERGWIGHFILADRCKFRRNTLLICGNTKIVISTVGLLENTIRKPLLIDKSEPFMEVGFNRYFETMAFHAKRKDTRYYDADVSRQINFDSPWSIDKIDADDKANEMHELVIAELTCKLLNREIK